MGLINQFPYSFTFGNINSADYGVWTSGSKTYDAPTRDVEYIKIQGRNGDLIQDNGRFNNIPIVYQCAIWGDIKESFNAFKQALMTQTGYQIITDTENPDVYREGALDNGIQPTIKPLKDSGVFDISFTCKPQRFLLDGSEYAQYYPVSNGGFDSSGANAEEEFCYRTEYIPIAAGAEFKASASYIDTSFHGVVLTAAFYDSNKSFISAISDGSQYTYINGWEQGTIGNTTGSDNANTTRCRTTGSFGFADAVGDVNISIASGFKLTVREYSGLPTSSSTFVGSWSEFATGEATLTPVKGHVYRFVVAKTDDSAITPDDVPPAVAKATYVVPQGVSYIDDFEQGLIRESDGTNNNTSTTRCRTHGVYNFDGAKSVAIMLPSGLKISGREYSGEDWSASNYVGVNFQYTAVGVSFAPVDGHYYRFVVGLANDANLTPQKIPVNGVEILTNVGFMSGWEQGDIGSSSGKNNDSTARCRTADALNFDGSVGDVSIVIASGYRLYSREYSGYPCTQNNYVGQVWSGATTSSATFTPTDGHYYRFVVVRDGYSTLLPTDVEPTAITWSVYTTTAADYVVSTVAPSGAGFVRVMYGAFMSTTPEKMACTVNIDGVETTYGDGGIILFNPTGYPAKPIISAQNTIGYSVRCLGANYGTTDDQTDITVTDYSATGRTDCVIDSVHGDAYSAEINGFSANIVSLNPYVTIRKSGMYADYPTLKAGANIIMTANNASGASASTAFDSCKIKTGWWTV